MTQGIAPDDLLLPGTRDARRLLIAWVVRQSAFPVFWLGMIAGVLLSPGHYVDANFDTVNDAWAELLSPAAGIAVALMIRIGTTVVGLVLALPLMRAFDAAGRAPGNYSGGRLRNLLDRVGATRGYQSLRFTAYVRDAAVARLGESGVRYDLIDRRLTASNFVLAGFTVLVTLLTGI